MKTDPLDFIRTDIAALPPYQPILPFHVLSETLGIPQRELVKLDANESPFGPLPEALEALAGIDTAHIYPDPESRQIRQKLADYYRLDPKSIVMGAGADELIDLVMRLLLSPGEAVLNCPPTFSMYDYDAVLNQAEVVSVPRKTSFEFDLPAIEAAVAANQPKLVFLASPNNPDGTLVPDTLIEKLLGYSMMVVVDEAYIHFSDKGESWINKVVQFPNLIVLRTFSKWAGLAGMRIGYGVFPKTLVPYLMKAKQPYNVSAAAELVACASMQHADKLEERAQQIIAERKRLYRLLAELPWLESLPGSQANFILVKVNGLAASEVSKRLREQGILIRYFDKDGLREYIRITVGTPAQSDKLEQALKEME
jgi:histidinol-phosphate aminotransferase